MLVHMADDGPHVFPGSWRKIAVSDHMGLSKRLCTWWCWFSLKMSVAKTMSSLSVPSACK
jgi:hypothetical protein